ncbi:MAG: leucine-rich repeat protein [Clostridia bacterium]|nr:leucine-rich repeat protein [Clostridia bacterium]
MQDNKNFKFCPNCGTPREKNGKFCPSCGFSYDNPDANGGQKEKHSKIKETFKNALNWVKSHLKIVIPIAVAVLLAIILAIAIPLGLAARNNGVYYKLGYDGELDKSDYIKINSGSWEDNDGEKGTYKLNGENVTFYVEFLGSVEELASGTLSNGVLALDIGGGMKEIYVTETHKHKFGEWETRYPATCTTDGLNVRTCACGVTERQELKAAGHQGEWKITKKPTCTAEGEKTRKCPVCNEDITEILEMLPHDIVLDYDAEKHWQVCSVCEFIPEEAPSAHYGNGKCTDCGYRDGYTLGLKFKLQHINDGFSKDGYAVSGLGTATDTQIVIPETYRGLPVIAIYSRAFYDKSSITSVTIPDSVEYVSSEAFTGTSATKTENGLIYADKWLIGCNDKSVTEINIIKSDTCGIAAGAFYGYKLTSITLPESVKKGEIGAELISATLSADSLEVLDAYDTLESVTITGGTKLHDYAFDDYYVLKNVTLPETLTEIGNSAFANCRALESIVIPDSVTRIGNDAFLACEALKSVKLPASLVSIGSFAFYNCESIESIALPSGLEKIYDRAFAGCSSLNNVTIPASVNYIEEEVFQSCHSLTRLVFEKTDGWKGTSQNYGQKNIPGKDLSDPAKAVELIMKTYCSYIWTRG